MTLTDITLKAGETREAVLVEDPDPHASRPVSPGSSGTTTRCTDERFAREVAGYPGCSPTGCSRWV